LTRSLQENRSFQLEEWRKDWISYSNEWQSGKELYAVKATGDALGIARSLYIKYFS
jgi:alpha-N-acetylglucosaminidase